MTGGVEPWAVLVLLLLANLVGVWAGRGSRATADQLDLELARVEITRLQRIIREQHDRIRPLT